MRGSEKFAGVEDVLSACRQPRRGSPEGSHRPDAFFPDEFEGQKGKAQFQRLSIHYVYRNAIRVL